MIVETPSEVKVVVIQFIVVDSTVHHVTTTQGEPYISTLKLMRKEEN